MVVGDAIRDWAQKPLEVAVFPYDATFRPIPNDPENPILRYLWQARVNLANSRMFGGKTKIQTGLQWYEYGRLTSVKLQIPLSITFAFVATHNHFVLDRGGKVFKQSAPVIKLPARATEDDHLGLLGLLNSSTASFWGRATLFPKGGFPDGRWQERLEWDGTKLLNFPLPVDRPLDLTRKLDTLARERVRVLPGALAEGYTPSAVSLLTWK